jgi:hypothetical protein
MYYKTADRYALSTIIASAKAAGAAPRLVTDGSRRIALRLLSGIDKAMRVLL